MIIGVIAEEKNDIEVLYAFTCKLVEESSFSFREFRAHGCGKLKKKCNSWASNLFTKGCSHLVVMHDLDKNAESELRIHLEKQIKEFSFTGKLILIPIMELEAWLLSDAHALKQTFNMQKLPKLPNHPETIQNPKEHLRDLVWSNCKKRYINTIHNKKIAEVIQLDKLSVCPSFLPYPEFLYSHRHN